MKTKRRSESFLGMHFDFHANSKSIVPTQYDPDSYVQALDAVCPDYIQCDTKGHPGLSSYPTNVGNRAELAPEIDILRMLRNETSKRGIALYAHYSGVYDAKAAELHPDWAIVNAEGQPSKSYMSVFGPYNDELLIPQLLELAGDYGLDGVWVDGDNWAHNVDYSHWATDAYKKATGREPAHPGEDGYIEYRDFCREGFKNYVRRYIAAVHEKYPDFQVTSNWIFSSKMTEAVDVPVDYLSGDTAPANSVNDASFQGHIFEARDLPWDLMMWGFHIVGDDWTTTTKQTKSLVQHCQEAAMIISLGGGFEFYNNQLAAGGLVQRWMIPVWKELADFARKREICHGGRLRKEVGILIPFERNENVNALFSPSDATRAAIQWIFVLQEMQYSAKVIFEHQLSMEEISQYRVIVLPASEHLKPSSVKLLEDYIKAGGSVLVDGTSSVFLQDFSGVKATVSEGPEQFFIEGKGKLSTVFSRHVTFEAPIENLGGNVFQGNYFGTSSPAYFHRNLGKGHLCALAFDLPTIYKVCKTETMRRFLEDIMESRLAFQPAISVVGSRYVQMTVLEKDGKLLVNLINMAGEHAVKEARQFEEIPPIGPLTVSISSGLGISKITQLPENKQLTPTIESNGTKRITIDRLELHTILLLEH